MTSVEFSNTVEKIEKKAFNKNSITGELIIPSNITSIGKQSFADNNIISLTTTNLSEIPMRAFYKNYNLQEINLNEGIVKIDDAAFNFMYIQPLRKIVIPSTVEVIEQYAFRSNYYSNDHPDTVSDITIINKTGKAFDWSAILLEDPSLFPEDCIYGEYTTGEYRVGNRIFTINYHIISE